MACVELELIDCAFPLPVLILHWIHLYKGIVAYFKSADQYIFIQKEARAGNFYEFFIHYV